MVYSKKLDKEIAALRAEVDALNAALSNEGSATAAASSAGANTVAQEAVALLGGQLPEQLQDFEKAVHDLAETVESDIAEHPVAAVGSAFLLGLLIGRLSAR